MHADARYPRALRVLHAVMAVVIVVQWALGFAAERSSDDATGWTWLRWHFQLGVVVAALLLLRIGARAALGVPHTVVAPRWQARAARGVHALLYACLLALPASGYVIWVWMDAPREVLGIGTLPAVFTPPGDDETGRAIAWYVHVGSAWMLSGLVALHVFAALWHHARDASRTYLRRIRPW